MQEQPHQEKQQEQKQKGATGGEAQVGEGATEAVEEEAGVEGATGESRGNGAARRIMDLVIFVFTKR